MSRMIKVTHYNIKKKAAYPFYIPVDAIQMVQPDTDNVGNGCYISLLYSNVLVLESVEQVLAQIEGKGN